MDNLRIYGSPPYRMAVLHGGPGAAGEMKPVAEALAGKRGILEPLQTAPSLEGQIRELKTVLERNAGLPAVLIGYSWGAWLGYLLAGEAPELVKKLILVSGGPFEAHYAENIMPCRLERLSPGERAEAETLLAALNRGKGGNRDVLEHFGRLLAKADGYDLLPESGEKITISRKIFQKVWPQAEMMRKSGELLRRGKQIRCPVLAIHGDYDPHPAAGVSEPLSGIIRDFRLVLLKHCGHQPWREREAQAEFYRILDQELSELSAE